MYFDDSDFWPIAFYVKTYQLLCTGSYGTEQNGTEFWVDEIKPFFCVIMLLYFQKYFLLFFL